MKYLLTLIAFFCLTPFASAAVAYDTSGSALSSSGTTIDKTITVGSNSNRVLVLLQSSDSAANHVSTVAYTAGSGGTWTLVANTKTNNGQRESEIWCSIAPSTGSVTVRVTMVNTIVGDAANDLHSFYNADQTAPCEGGTSGGIVSSIGVTTQSDSMAAYVVVTPGGPGTFSGAATASDSQVAFNAFHDFLHGTGNGGTLTLSWTNSARSVSALNIKAAAAAPTGNVIRMIVNSFLSLFGGMYI